IYLSPPAGTFAYAPAICVNEWASANYTIHVVGSTSNGQIWDTYTPQLESTPFSGWDRSAAELPQRSIAPSCQMARSVSWHSILRATYSTSVGVRVAGQRLISACFKESRLDGRARDSAMP